MAVSPRRHLAGLRRAEHGGFNERERLALGLGSRPVLDFSASTNPFGPPPGVLEAFRNADVTRYPDPEALELREEIASRHGVPAGCVIAGNGSVELIWLAAMAYLEPGRRAMVLGPTFGEYEAAARAAGAEVVEVRADEQDGFNHDLGALGPSSVTFLCNPNNPTGVLMPAVLMRDAVRRHPDTLFVVDEAYLPFAPSGQSCLDAGLMDNLLVLRSMTKDCGIPGLRLGYGVGTRPVIEALHAVQPPWTVNAPAQAAGLAALVSDSYVQECGRSLEPAREYLVAGLRGSGLTVLDGQANFVLVRTGDGAALRRALLFEGCCVRDCASFGLPEYVRVGVRTIAECDVLVAAVGRVVGRGAYPSHDRKGVPQLPSSRVREPDDPRPLAYLITFTCYGTRLHGDERGTVARARNIPGTPTLPPDPSKIRAITRTMIAPAYELDPEGRSATLRALQEVCAHRGWSLLAAHVRSTHVHAVVHGTAPPERMMNDFKAYASRHLGGARHWTRHGSTRYLWQPEDVEAGIHYVVRAQGEPMAVYEGLEG